MKIGLIDVDNIQKKRCSFPNLPLMKLSAFHKTRGDEVGWWFAPERYDIVYKSKVFDFTPDIDYPIYAERVVEGGSGYDLNNHLPDEVEHIYPDYALYKELTRDTAYGFLTRGCPRGCKFCIVADKEGYASKKVADLSEWWRGQKKIKLLDPNLLACREHIKLLGQLESSGAWVDFTQGLDCRLLTQENIQAINAIRLKDIHFAWDYMTESEAVLRGLQLYADHASRKVHGAYATVYCLTNYNTTMEENLYRIYTLRDMGYDPYVMIYDKANAPRETRKLQRWVNNRIIFKTVQRFEDYDTRTG